MASLPLSLPGAHLTLAFVDIVHSSLFKKLVWTRMSLSEKQRLYALQQQALYGDAPTAKASDVPSPAPSSPDRSPDDGHGMIRTKAGQQQPSLPPWYDLAGQARYQRWVVLRGRMSPDVAAECFCADFIGLLNKYPHPSLVPPVEAALARAERITAAVEADALKSTSLPQNRSNNATSTSTSLLVFCVHALQGDPAATALLWLCRAYQIPCELTLEPLSSALQDHGGRMADEDAAFITSLVDANFPFTASLMEVPNLGSAADGVVTASVDCPEAAMLLLLETFFNASSHWSGTGVRTSSETQLRVSPCHAELMDELCTITKHLRTPILALLAHQACMGSSVGLPASPARTSLFRRTAEHFHAYQQWMMQRALPRRLGNVCSALPPLLASTAVVQMLSEAYAPDAKVVSAADLLVASCGYVLCTHPYCADIFPYLQSAPSLGQTGRKGVALAWSTALRGKEPSSGSSGESSYRPWELPLHLSGMPAEYNRLVNNILKQEARGAVRVEERKQPSRVVVWYSVAHSPTSSDPTSSDATPQNYENCFYPVTSGAMAPAAAEAVSKLIFSRLSSLKTDDLLQDGPNSTRSISGAPFLVLTHSLALAWVLSQEQVPGYPYFMADGNPSNTGALSFLNDVAPGKSSRQQQLKEELHRRFLQTQVPTTSSAAVSPSVEEHRSLESHLRCGAQAVGQKLLFWKAAKQRPGSTTEKASVRVYETHELHQRRRSAGPESASRAAAVAMTSKL